MKKIDDLRKRLEALNRAPLGIRDGGGKSAEEDLRRHVLKRRAGPRSASAGKPGANADAPPIVFHRDMPRPAPRDLPQIIARRPHVTLEEAVQCVEVAAPDGARVYLLERNLAECEEGLEGICDGLLKALERRDSGLHRQFEYLGLAGEWRPEDLIFLDVETTGLGSCPLFLIGTMVWGKAGLTVRQYFARDYSQERSALSLFLQSASERGLLVSFNGKSFDFPCVRVRAAANRVEFRYAPAHVDLLHAARRVWRSRLPDCRLQTLESFICCRSRPCDIPSHLIPEAYHEYVRTGNAIEMVQVIEHNFLDLVTMAELIVRMPDAGEA